MRIRAVLVAVVSSVLASSLSASCAVVDTIAPPDRSLAAVPGDGGSARGVGDRRCGLPAPGQDFEAVDPASAGVAPDAVRNAIARLAPQFTVSLRIYRHDCLIGQTVNDAVADTRPAELFSMTKSVVSLAVGRAVSIGRLGLDDPIGRHLPGLDAAHAAITVRQLLTQTSGLRFAWVNDLAGSAEDSVGEAMSMPFAHPPGTYFEYAQTTVSTLALVVGRAVGQDFQAFVQQELFGPVGIRPGTWSWWRDGVGNTHGYAWLRMLPPDMARLATLVLHRGVWNGRRLIDESYIRQMSAGTATNPGYGFLTQPNEGAWYIDTFAGVRRDHHEVPSAPADLLQFSGFLEQATFVVPSLDLVVVRFGLPPGANWKYHLFANLLAGIDGARAVSPGPPPEPDAIGWDWETIFDWADLLSRVDQRRACPEACGDRWASPVVPTS
ncbi:MAG: serine hydrolase domain-containing protein [Acidimicrobiales bacterium]